MILSTSDISYVKGCDRNLNISDVMVVKQRKNKVGANSKCETESLVGRKSPRLSSCSKSHLVQNPTLFKIPRCSKSHLAQNPILLSLFLFPLRLLSISLLILRLAQSPNLLKHPSGSNSCLAVALLVPHLLVENVLADSHTCCQSACSLYRLLFVSLPTLHLLKGAGPQSLIHSDPTNAQYEIKPSDMQFT